MAKNDSKELHSILEQLKKSYASDSDVDENDIESLNEEAAEDVDDGFQNLLTNFFSSDNSDINGGGTYNFTISEEASAESPSEDSDIAKEDTVEEDDITEDDTIEDDVIEEDDVIDEDDIAEDDIEEDVIEEDDIVEEDDLTYDAFDEDDVINEDDIKEDDSVEEDIADDISEGSGAVPDDETSYDTAADEPVITGNILNEPIDKTKKDEVTAVENVFRIMFGNRGDATVSAESNAEDDVSDTDISDTDIDTELDVTSDNFPALEDSVEDEDPACLDDTDSYDDVAEPDIDDTYDVSDDKEQYEEYTSESLLNYKDGIDYDDIGIIPTGNTEEEIDTFDDTDVSQKQNACDTVSVSDHTDDNGQDAKEDSDEYIYDPLQGHLSDAAYVVHRSIDGDINMKPENDKESALDDDDISLLLDFGYDDDINSEAGAGRTSRIKRDIQNKKGAYSSRLFGYSGKEYLDPSQKDEIRARYTHDKRGLIVKTAFTTLIAVVLIFFGVMYWMDQTLDQELYPYIEMLCVLAVSAIAAPGLIEGIVGIAKLDPVNYSVSAFLVIIQLVYDIFLIIFENSSYVVADDRIMTSGAIVILYVICALISDILQCEAEACTFDVVSSDGVLYSAERFNKTNTEKNEKNGRRNLTSSDNLLGNNIYRVRRADIANGYFHRMSKKSVKCMRVMYFMGIVPIAALIIGCITLVTNGNSYAALSSVVTVIFMGLPVSFSLVSTIPYYYSVKKMKKYGSAIVSESSFYEYSELDTLMFDDRDAVDITESVEIRPENNVDVSEAITLAERAFRSLGDPIAKLFSGSTDTSCADINIISVRDNGIEFYMDSHLHVVIGDRNFMAIHGMKVVSDSAVTASSQDQRSKCVIYVAFDGVPQLGYIVSSRIREEFTNTVRMLAGHGIKTAVTTYSPYINDYYFEANKPVGVASAIVYKPCVFEDNKNESGFVDGGVYSLGDPSKIADAVIESRSYIKAKAQNKSFSTLMAVLGTVLGIVSVILLMIPSSENIKMGIFSSALILVFNIISALGIFCRHIDVKKKK